MSRYVKFAASVLLSACLGYLIPHSFSLLQHLERRTEDIRIAGFSRAQSQDKNIAIVAINEETLQKFPYRSPVDREFLSQLLKTLEEKEAKAIYLDVLLDQPTEPVKDQILFDTLRSLKTPIVVGYTNSKEVLNADQLNFINTFVSSEMRGTVNLATDPFDGTVRWIYGGDASKGQPLGVPYKVVKHVVTQDDSLLNSKSTTDLETIAWSRPEKIDESPFALYPAQAIAFMPKEWIAGKIVLVGAVLSITDRHRTPFAVFKEDSLGMMSGVEIFAHQISQLLNKKSVNEVSCYVQCIFILTLALLGGLLGAWRKSIALTVSVASFIIASYWVFVILGYEYGVPLLPLLGPSLSFLTALFLVEFLLGKEDRERRAFIQSAFSRYLAPSVVQQLVDHPDSLSIAGKKRTLSFIFTDIESFTTLSEKIPPDQLSNLLNQYLEGMCAQVQNYQGIVDKFIGDSVMAFFNAPMDQPDHADRALECALAIDKFSQEFRKELATQGIQMGVTRIGIHSGEAVVGNFGSMSRMEFTALGDTVNAASRTEGVNKYFGTRICVTQETLRHLTRSLIKTRPIGHVYLKGKNKPIDLFEPVSQEFSESSCFVEYLKAYQHLDAGEDLAASYFEELQKKYPDDSLVNFHLKRLNDGHRDASVVMEEK